MKKKIQEILNKLNNIILCIGACVLILSISFNGTTFAWLYGSVSANSGEFKFAKIDVKCEKDDIQNLEFINFKLSDLNFARKLVTLENDLYNSRNYKDNTATGWNGIFEQWWKDNGNTVSNSYLMPTNTVILGNIIRKESTFTNNSSIPVYLRIKSPEIQNISVDIAYFVDFKDDEWKKDGEYWYLLKPLMTSATNKTVVFEVIAYVPQLANALNYNFIGEVDIIIDHAEAIQATNNAIYHADGWKTLADKGLFKPYLK